MVDLDTSSGIKSMDGHMHISHLLKSYIVKRLKHGCLDMSISEHRLMLMMRFVRIFFSSFLAQVSSCLHLFYRGCRIRVRG